MNCKKSLQAIKRTLTFVLAFAMVATSLYVAPVAYAVEEGSANDPDVIEEVVEEEAIVETQAEVEEAAAPEEEVTLEEVVEEAEETAENAGALDVEISDGAKILNKSKAWTYNAAEVSDLEAIAKELVIKSGETTLSWADNAEADTKAVWYGKDVQAIEEITGTSVVGSNWVVNILVKTGESYAETATINGRIDAGSYKVEVKAAQVKTVGGKLSIADADIQKGSFNFTVNPVSISNYAEIFKITWATTEGGIGIKGTGDNAVPEYNGKAVKDENISKVEVVNTGALFADAVPGDSGESGTPAGALNSVKDDIKSTLKTGGGADATLKAEVKAGTGSLIDASDDIRKPVVKIETTKKSKNYTGSVEIPFDILPYDVANVIKDNTVKDVFKVTFADDEHGDGLKKNTSAAAGAKDFLYTGEPICKGNVASIEMASTAETTITGLSDVTDEIKTLLKKINADNITYGFKEHTEGDGTLVNVTEGNNSPSVAIDVDDIDPNLCGEVLYPFTIDKGDPAGKLYVNGVAVTTNATSGDNEVAVVSNVAEYPSATDQEATENTEKISMTAFGGAVKAVTATKVTDISSSAFFVANSFGTIDGNADPLKLQYGMKANSTASAADRTVEITLTFANYNDVTLKLTVEKGTADTATVTPTVKWAGDLGKEIAGAAEGTTAKFKYTGVTVDELLWLEKGEEMVPATMKWYRDVKTDGTTDADWAITTAPKAIGVYKVVATTSGDTPETLIAEFEIVAQTVVGQKKLSADDMTFSVSEFKAINDSNNAAKNKLVKAMTYGDSDYAANLLASEITYVGLSSDDPTPYQWTGEGYDEDILEASKIVAVKKSGTTVNEDIMADYIVNPFGYKDSRVYKGQPYVIVKIDKTKTNSNIIGEASGGGEKDLYVAVMVNVKGESVKNPDDTVRYNVSFFVKKDNNWSKHLTIPVVSGTTVAMSETYKKVTDLMDAQNVLGWYVYQKGAVVDWNLDSEIITGETSLYAFVKSEDNYSATANSKDTNSKAVYYIAPINWVEYNGTKQKPVPTVFKELDGKTTVLTNKKDYTVRYTKLVADAGKTESCELKVTIKADKTELTAKYGVYETWIGNTGSLANIVKAPDRKGVVKFTPQATLKIGKATLKYAKSDYKYTLQRVSGDAPEGKEDDKRIIAKTGEANAAAALAYSADNKKVFALTAGEYEFTVYPDKNTNVVDEASIFISVVDPEKILSNYKVALNDGTANKFKGMNLATTRKAMRPNVTLTYSKGTVKKEYKYDAQTEKWTGLDDGISEECLEVIYTGITGDVNNKAEVQVRAEGDLFGATKAAKFKITADAKHKLSKNSLKGGKLEKIAKTTKPTVYDGTAKTLMDLEDVVGTETTTIAAKRALISGQVVLEDADKSNKAYGRVFDIVYSNNIKASKKATATIVAKPFSGYTGSVKVTFPIAQVVLDAEYAADGNKLVGPASGLTFTGTGASKTDPIVITADDLSTLIGAGKFISLNEKSGKYVINASGLLVNTTTGAALINKTDFTVGDITNAKKADAQDSTKGLIFSIKGKGNYGGKGAKKVFFKVVVPGGTTETTTPETTPAS